MSKLKLLALLLAVGNIDCMQQQSRPSDKSGSGALVAGAISLAATGLLAWRKHRASKSEKETSSDSTHVIKQHLLPYGMQYHTSLFPPCLPPVIEGYELERIINYQEQSVKIGSMVEGHAPVYESVRLAEHIYLFSDTEKKYAFSLWSTNLFYKNEFKGKVIVGKDKWYDQLVLYVDERKNITDRFPASPIFGEDWHNVNFRNFKDRIA